MPEMKTRKTYQGVVTSSKMNKTIVVTVQRTMRHKRYEKVITRGTKFYVHDEDNSAKVGDKVCIEETRPISKLKNFRVTKSNLKTKRDETQ
jgi:small subunit ribosomal protein S17